jgi:hypothetical protein
MADRDLSPGEQIVTTFAGGSHPPLAIRLAARAVQRLREVEVDNLPRPSERCSSRCEGLSIGVGTT